MQIKHCRTEYPRPQFARANWQNLNGEWDFAFDDEEKGELKNYFRGFKTEKTINVPFTYQTAASGVGTKEMHEVMWYQKSFVPGEGLSGKRVLLCFNAVDYRADVWLNGERVGEHEGGYSAFSFDVSDLLKDGENLLVVKATDRYDTAQPRGKQYWEAQPNRCWYHGNSGIWQSVWLEEIGEAYIDYALITPDIDRSLIDMSFNVCGKSDAIKVTVFYKGEKVKEQTETTTGKRTNIAVKLKEPDSIDECHYWTPWCPNLYDVTLELISGGKTVDRVETYFGMRKISVDGKYIRLNNSPLYQRLILDQGYWKDTDITPPSADALKRDIELCKEMGFNGARKHQKVEDPYYYYYADKLGFLVWGEMPSAYNFCLDEIENIQSQFAEEVKQLYNHPSVIAYVPMNESWGVRKLVCDRRQKDFVRAMYYTAKALDGTRLVCGNDGWEQVEDTDFIGIHDYAPTGDGFVEKYTGEDYDYLYPMGRRLMGYGEKYNNIPVIMTEYGGIALKSSGAVGIHEEDNNNWGYVVDDNADDFMKRYENLTEAVKKCGFAGFCYTQLTDVNQEVNGLLDADHEPKFAQLDKIRKINE